MSRGGGRLHPRPEGGMEGAGPLCPDYSTGQPMGQGCGLRLRPHDATLVFPKMGPPPCASWCLQTTPQPPGHPCCFEDGWRCLPGQVGGGRALPQVWGAGQGWWAWWETFGTCRLLGGSAILPPLPGNHLLRDSCWGPGSVPGPLWLSLSSPGGPAGGQGCVPPPPEHSRASHVAERSDMGRAGVSRSR